MGAVALVVFTACDTDDVAEETIRSATGLEHSTFAPSGLYDISTRVLADDCSPAYAPPATWRERVFTAAEDGHAKVNLPLSGLPPQGLTRATARSDFSLEPGFSRTDRMKPVRDCDAFTIDYAYTLQRPSSKGFELVVDVTYGDPGSCKTTSPTSCTTKVQYDYVLATAECAAECTRGVRPAKTGVSDGPVEWLVDCRCP